jgi:hypothetical protein
MMLIYTGIMPFVLLQSSGDGDPQRLPGRDHLAAGTFLRRVTRRQPQP